MYRLKNVFRTLTNHLCVHVVYRYWTWVLQRVSVSPSDSCQ